MKQSTRRKVLAVVGTAVASGALATGSGAFTSGSVSRGVTINVESDSEGYLSLVPGPDNGKYINNSNGLFHIDLTSNNEDLAGNGLNPNSFFVAEAVFEIQNSGPQAVEVTPSPLAFVKADGGDTLLFVIVPETTPQSNFPTVQLGVGEAETYGIVALVDGSGDTGLEINQKVTVSAEAI